MNEQTELPDHWERIPVADFAELISGQHILSDDYHQEPDDGGTPYLTGPADFGDDYPEVSKWTHKPKAMAQEGDVLLTVKGANVGKTNVLDINEAAISRQLMAIRPKTALSKYIYYYFRNNFSAFQRLGAGSTVPGIDQESVLGFEVPLPPLPEQRRIVAKIEELFTNLDAGQSDLATAERQLERYRLSVLQAAVEGRLTADWRRTHDPEHADQLLERILEERREKWEERYKWERYESKGKEPPSGWKDRYTKPDPPDETDLRELPQCWKWSRLGHAFFVHLGATPRRSRDDFWGGDIAWASSSEINQREITHTEESITEAGLEDTSTQVLPPGTLMLGMIGQGRTRGMVAELKIPAATSQNSAAIEVAHSSVPPKWVYYYLESQYHELRRMGSGNNQKALNKGIVQEIPIPLPPLAEQKQIVDEVERLLSVADDAAATAEREQTRAERLRQSILKQAFSGRLVPHVEDAAPPQVDGSVSEGPDSDSSEGADEDVEDLLGSADSSKQIEMDL